MRRICNKCGAKRETKFMFVSGHTTGRYFSQGEQIDLYECKHVGVVVVKDCLGNVITNHSSPKLALSINRIALFTNQKTKTDENKTEKAE